MQLQLISLLLVYNCLFRTTIAMLAKTIHTEIWTTLQNGDQHALLSLYNAHYTGLMNYGIKLTSNRELTHDCITQILLHLWEKRNKLPKVENVRSYLLTCLRHEIFAALKKENLRQSRKQQLIDPFLSAELSYEEYLVQIQTNKSIKEKLLSALAKLTDREKELLKLRFFEDLDYDEIAIKCGITKRTAYNILHTAIKTLKTEFADKPHLSFVYGKALLLTAIIGLIA